MSLGFTQEAFSLYNSPVPSQKDSNTDSDKLQSKGPVKQVQIANLNKFLSKCYYELLDRLESLVMYQSFYQKY